MTAKPKVFNPFGDDATNAGAQSTAKESEKKPYETTGVSARDQVRKMLFETFVSEGHDEAESAMASELIENGIFALIEDPKSRQFRDKARQI